MAAKKQKLESVPDAHPFFGGLRDFITHLKTLDLKQKQVQVEIDGLVYTSAKFPASVGLNVLPRMGALLGPALAKVLSTGEGGEDVTGEALLAFADKAMTDGLSPLVRDLLSRMLCNQLATSQDGGPVLSDFDEHFSGEYLHLLKVLFFATMHNFMAPTRGTR
jgi:hypothetical protein